MDDSLRNVIGRLFLSVVVSDRLGVGHSLRDI